MAEMQINNASTACRDASFVCAALEEGAATYLVDGARCTTSATIRSMGCPGTSVTLCRHEACTLGSSQL